MKKLGKGAQPELAEAAEHLRLALHLLDSVEAPPHIGAHVDLALHQLEDELMNQAQLNVSATAGSVARH